MSISRKKTTKPTSPPVSLGVTTVRRSVPIGDASEPLLAAAAAGEASGMFPKGGHAFAIWCAEQGINPNEKKRRSHWDTLLAQFSSRPIYGYRRGPHGGSHENGRR